MLPSYIKYFNTRLLGRSFNDFNNKYREIVINNMPKFDKTFYDDPVYGDDWINFVFNFNKSIKLLCNVYCSYTILHKGGRKHNYDYLITFFDKTNNVITNEKIEFKYNAVSIDDAPQFVSPMNPSKYLSQSFEGYYYDNYFTQLLQEYNFPIPDRNLYINTVGNNKPCCVKNLQELYYQGCKQSSKYTGTDHAICFYNRCKYVSNECIGKFIGETELNTELLSRYLIESQDKKIYLLYKNNQFHLQTTNNDDYIITSYTKQPSKNMYIAQTKSGKQMKILLRWKNGNGIAYPAFQIS